MRAESYCTALLCSLRAWFCSTQTIGNERNRGNDPNALAGNIKAKVDHGDCTMQLPYHGAELSFRQPDIRILLHIQKYRSKCDTYHAQQVKIQACFCCLSSRATSSQDKPRSTLPSLDTDGIAKNRTHFPTTGISVF